VRALAECEPQWARETVPTSPDGGPNWDLRGYRRILIFNCPVHVEKLSVRVGPTAYGFRLPGAKKDTFVWQGDDQAEFSRLTLAPSIWFKTEDGGCGWHGWLKDGWLSW
jgi:hypothetical protein